MTLKDLNLGDLKQMPHLGITLKSPEAISREYSRRTDKEYTTLSYILLSQLKKLHAVQYLVILQIIRKASTLPNFDYGQCC